jgi:RNA polymerase sigma factor (sigma-70 family)
MPGARARDALKQLNTLFQCGTTGHLRDAELLESFARGRDERAEAAFAALVERHGKMVLGVCQRVLLNRESAEDAFQATFLVLARKAASIARGEQLANWLYGVALRAALDARSRIARQKACEKRYRSMVPAEMPDPCVSGELRAALDEELARLPERYRAAIVLCELEGLSRREAAARLGIAEGTLSSRLARAKLQLKDRLTRRGFTLSSAELGTFLAHEARAVAVPTALVDSTIGLATLVSSGSSLTGIVSTSVATLTEGVLKAMLLTKVKSALLGFATLAVITTGVGVLAQTGPGGGASSSSPDDRLKAVERKLDKLLEVLGGSSRANPQPVAAASSDVAPASNPAAAAPASGLPAGPGMPLDQPTSDAVPVNASTPAPYQNLGPPGGAPPTLVGRVQTLEHRLDLLERRLNDLEQKLPRQFGRGGSRASEPFGTSSRRGGSAGGSARGRANPGMPPPSDGPRAVPPPGPPPASGNPLESSDLPPPVNDIPDSAPPEDNIPR